MQVPKELPFLHCHSYLQQRVEELGYKAETPLRMFY